MKTTQEALAKQAALRAELPRFTAGTHALLKDRAITRRAAGLACLVLLKAARLVLDREW